MLYITWDMQWERQLLPSTTKRWNNILGASLNCGGNIYTTFESDVQTCLSRKLEVLNGSQRKRRLGRKSEIQGKLFSHLVTLTCRSNITQSIWNFFSGKIHWGEPQEVQRKTYLSSADECPFEKQCLACHVVLVVFECLTMVLQVFQAAHHGLLLAF